MIDDEINFLIEEEFMPSKIDLHRYVSFINNETKEPMASLHVRLDEIIDLLPKERIITKVSLVGRKVYISPKDLDIFLKQWYLNNGESND